MLEGTKFALGATMAVRKKSFRDVGGFGELGQFYADDFELGNRLAKAGDRGEDGDAHHQADGAGYAVLALVPESAAVDAEYAALSAVGAPGEWVDVRHAVWGAGIYLWGIGLRAHDGWVLLWLAAMVREPVGAGGDDPGSDGDPDWAKECGDLSAAGSAGKSACGWGVMGEQVLLSGKIYTLKPGGRVEAPE